MTIVLDDINELLEYSKNAIYYITHFNNFPDEIKSINSLIFAGMISYYGFEHVNEIYNAFLKTNFSYTDKVLYDFVVQQKNVTQKMIDFVNNPDVMAFLDYDLRMDEFGKYHINRRIYVSQYDRTPDEFIENLIHEINHVVNSINFPIYVRNSDKIVRTGIALYWLNSDYSESSSFDEAVNVLQTAEIMEHILDFCDYHINDSEMKYVLDSIKCAHGKSRDGFGYENIVPLVRPLYKDKTFKEVTELGRISGEIKSVREKFDNKTYKGAFLDISNGLDVLMTDINLFEQIKCKNKVKSIVKQYISN